MTLNVGYLALALITWHNTDHMWQGGHRITAAMAAIIGLFFALIGIGIWPS